MSSRKSPTGPSTSFTGFVIVPLTQVAGSAIATVGLLAQIQIGPTGTAIGNMNGLKMTTNDIVSASPRSAVAIGTVPNTVVFSHARVSAVSTVTSVGTATIELSFGNLSSAASTLTPGTWSINVDLMSADL